MQKQRQTRLASIKSGRNAHIPRYLLEGQILMVMLRNQPVQKVVVVYLIHYFYGVKILLLVFTVNHIPFWFLVMQDLTEEVVGILETAGSSIQWPMLMCVQKSKIWIKFERRGRRKQAKFLIWRVSRQRVKNLAERGAIRAIRAIRGEIKEEGVSKVRKPSDRKTWILFIIMFYLYVQTSK